jgi:hypothetical protein
MIRYAIQTPIGFSGNLLNCNIDKAKLWVKHDDALKAKTELIRHMEHWLNTPQPIYFSRLEITRKKGTLVHPGGRRMRFPEAVATAAAKKPIIRKFTPEEIAELRIEGKILTRQDLKDVKVVKIEVTRKIV